MLKGVDLKEVLSQTQAAEKVYQLKKPAEESGEEPFAQKLLKVQKEKKNRKDSSQQKPTLENKKDKYEKEQAPEENQKEKLQSEIEDAQTGIDVKV